MSIMCMCMRLKERTKDRMEERREMEQLKYYTHSICRIESSTWAFTLGAMCAVFLFFFLLLLAEFQFIFVACYNKELHTHSLFSSFASKTHSHTNLSCSPFPLSVVLFFLFFFVNSTSILYSVLVSFFSRLICVFVRKEHNVELKNVLFKRLNFYALIQIEKFPRDEKKKPKFVYLIFCFGYLSIDSI